jgi:hypothetical protein
VKQIPACAVIPADSAASCKDAGIQKPDWMPPAYYMPGQAYQVRHDVQHPTARGGAVYSLDIFLIFLDP